jgi:hypothetical protein
MDSQRKGRQEMTTRGAGGGVASCASNERSGHPFPSIESAYEYVGLLLQAIEETAVDVDEDLGDARQDGSARRREVFQLIAYKLGQLRFHLSASRRLLNDLRTLRRMLEGTRSVTPMAS